jgi:hypothetical protein
MNCHAWSLKFQHGNDNSLNLNVFCRIHYIVWGANHSKSLLHFLKKSGKSRGILKSLVGMLQLKKIIFHAWHLKILADATGWPPTGRFRFCILTYIKWWSDICYTDVYKIMEWAHHMFLKECQGTLIRNLRKKHFQNCMITNGKDFELFWFRLTFHVILCDMYIDIFNQCIIIMNIAGIESPHFNTTLKTNPDQDICHISD